MGRKIDKYVRTKSDDLFLNYFEQPRFFYSTMDKFCDYTSDK